MKDAEWKGEEKRGERIDPIQNLLEDVFNYDKKCSALSFYYAGIYSYQENGCGKTTVLKFRTFL